MMVEISPSWKKLPRTIKVTRKVKVNFLGPQHEGSDQHGRKPVKDEGASIGKYRPHEVLKKISIENC